jgi:hypothetical protein
MSTNILPATTAPLNSTSPPDTLRPHIHAVRLDQYYCRTARDPPILKVKPANPQLTQHSHNFEPPSHSLPLGHSYNLPVGLAGILDRAVLVGAKDLLQAVLRLHLGTQGGGAEGDGKGPLHEQKHTTRPASDPHKCDGSRHPAQCFVIQEI